MKRKKRFYTQLFSSTEMLNCPFPTDSKETRLGTQTLQNFRDSLTKPPTTAVANTPNTVHCLENYTLCMSCCVHIKFTVYIYAGNIIKNENWCVCNSFCIFFSTYFGKQGRDGSIQCQKVLKEAKYLLEDKFSKAISVCIALKRWLHFHALLSMHVDGTIDITRLESIVKRGIVQFSLFWSI